MKACLLIRTYCQENMIQVCTQSQSVQYMIRRKYISADVDASTSWRGTRPPIRTSDHVSHTTNVFFNLYIHPSHWPRHTSHRTNNTMNRYLWYLYCSTPHQHKWEDTARQPPHATGWKILETPQRMRSNLSVASRSCFTSFVLATRPGTFFSAEM